MNNLWKNRTCENCMYRDKTICRRFPPTIFIESEAFERFPQIKSQWNVFQIACSYYEETK